MPRLANHSMTNKQNPVGILLFRILQSSFFCFFSISEQRQLFPKSTAYFVNSNQRHFPNIIIIVGNIYYSRLCLKYFLLKRLHLIFITFERKNQLTKKQKIKERKPGLGHDSVEGPDGPCQQKIISLCSYVPFYRFQMPCLNRL